MIYEHGGGEEAANERTHDRFVDSHNADGLSPIKYSRRAGLRRETKGITRGAGNYSYCRSFGVCVRRGATREARVINNCVLCYSGGEVVVIAVVDVEDSKTKLFQVSGIVSSAENPHEGAWHLH